MAKYEIAYWGNVFDDLIADFAPIDAMEYFREKYGLAVIDICGVRLIKDGVML